MNYKHFCCRFIIILLLSAVSGYLLATAARFDEDFSSTIFRDPAATTASWDTTTGVLSLELLEIADLMTIPFPGSAEHAVVSGNLLMIAAGTNGFFIYDITDPSTLSFVGSYYPSGPVMGIDIAGDHAFLAAGSSGLVILDISQPGSIMYSGSAGAGTAYSVSVEGDYAYVAGGSSGLHVIDISDPSAPATVGSLAPTGGVYDLEVAGNFVYLTDYLGQGLDVIDVSDPSAPTRAGNYALGTARGLDIAGNVAYVANHTSGLYTIDITDPTSPTLLDIYDSPGYCRDVHVSGDYAYVADGDGGGIRVVDISDPSDIDIIYATYTGTGPLDVTRSGELLLISDGTGGLVIKRIVSAMPPDSLSSAYSGSFITDPEVEGDFLFAPNFNAGMRVVDITDPFNIVEAGYYTDTPVYGISVQGDTAFIAGYDQGLVVIDVSDPTSPTYISRTVFPVYYFFDIDVSGDIACGAAGADGLIVFDVSDPAAPVQIGSYDSPGSAAAVKIDGDVAWVPSESGGLHIYDISDPTDPDQYMPFQNGYAIYDIELAGDFAFISLGINGMAVLDISDPSYVMQVGSYIGEYSCRNIKVEGNYAFVAGLYDGGLVLDVSDPYHPRLVTRYIQSEGSIYDLAIEGDFVYFTGYEFGVQSMRIYDHYYEGLDNKAASIDLVTGGQEIRRLRLTTSEMGDIDWEFSLDQGGSWQGVEPNTGLWTKMIPPGDDLRWRAELFASAFTPDESPECASLSIEWLNESAVIDSVVDVPGDQGGYVRVHFKRSSKDFIDEDESPVTGYDIYRRVDDPLLASMIVEKNSQASGPCVVSLDGREFIVSGSLSAPGFPPGVWENVSSVHALQVDSYMALVPTEADSSADIPYEAFVLTTHTTMPAVWFVSEPDSGYSVDNIAPGVPLAMAVAYNTGSGNALSWDPSPEEDFQYYRVYRGGAEDFVPGPGNLAHETASPGWTDPDYDGWGVYYKVTALDDAGNESDPASPGTVTGTGQTATPKAFALHQNYPNPFNPSTSIRFDLPKATHVKLAVYNVKGELVATLVDRRMDEGRKDINWNGLDSGGGPSASGIYFYRIVAGDFTMTRKMVLLR